MIQVDCSEGYQNQNQYEVQSAYFRHQTFSIFTACSYFHPSGTADIEKVPITNVSEVNDQSRLVSFTCVSKVIDCIKERIPLLSSLQSLYIWCSVQFRSRFTFVWLTHLHPDKDIEWNYSKDHHGKGRISRIDGTIKNKVFKRFNQEGLSSTVQKILPCTQAT